MRILITNDDGITANGIQALIDAMMTIGDVVVVAPDRQQSAVGHALTVSSPLRATPYHRRGVHLGYAINGTPADCVKLAVSTLLTERPDIVVSGINHGNNSSVNAIYSGTVSAATEGTLMGIPSMAISVASFDEDFDMTLAQKIAIHVAKQLLTVGVPAGTLLNVNIPAVAESEHKGIKITRQGSSVWEDYYEIRRDPHGKDYYWLTGNFVTLEELPDADDIAVKDGYTAITPLHYELTNQGIMETLKSNAGLTTF
ncbi:MAG: 5'/3'-nucleotidase SurE [Ignavibacteria bacterium]|nr:5'/3'-nucleotidase SurE [Ignavibacteria bacterium]